MNNTMKNLLLITLFLSGLYSAQTLSKNEVNFNDIGLAYLTKDIHLKNGKNEMSKVNLSVSIIKEFSHFVNYEKLDEIIDATLSESKNTLKNPTTFNPISLKIKVLDEKGILIWVDYTGENDYGGTKYGSKLIYFDEKGKITKTL